MLFVATVVAKHTSVLCNTCHLASSKTSNPVAKRHLVRSAKKIANSTDNLVKAIMVSVAVKYESSIKVIYQGDPLIFIYIRECLICGVLVEQKIMFAGVICTHVAFSNWKETVYFECHYRRKLKKTPNFLWKFINQYQ